LFPSRDDRLGEQAVIVDDEALSDPDVTCSTALVGVELTAV